jgi:ribA/ribD-fused uncharacterized protein
MDNRGGKDSSKSENVKVEIVVPSVTDEYGFINPFYEKGDKFKDNKAINNDWKEKEYLSVEHYFQTQKFIVTDPEFAKKLSQAISTEEAHQMGTNKEGGGIMRPDWDSIKFDVMYRGYKLFFVKNWKLKEKLLETGEKNFVQKSKADRYWCRDYDKGSSSIVGMNMLGEVLLEIRKTFRKGKRKIDN